MRRTAFLWLASACVTGAQIALGAPNSTVARLDAAILRLPAAYREAAHESLHLTGEDLAYVEKESDEEWTGSAIARLFRTPEGRAFLLKRLEVEPEGALRASILKEAGNVEQYVAFFPYVVALTAAEVEAIRKHAAADPDPDAALEALKVVRNAHRADEKGLLDARRKQGDASVLSEFAWNRYPWFGETHNPLYNYSPPPVFSAAPPDEPVRVLAFGDFGTGSEGQVKDAAAMLAYHGRHPFNFGLTLGDNFYGRGLDSPANPRWQSQWEQLYSPLGIKFYPVYGNHDYGDPDSPAAELAYSAKSTSWVFPAAYYSYTAGAAQFFAIDNIRLTDSELAWLDSELGKSTAKWKIVYGHYHIYSATRGDNDDKWDNLIGRLLPILEKHHVQIYLNGHDHNMQEARTESPVHFFTSGAGGAQLYDLKPTYKRSVFKDRQFGFTVVELDGQHVDVIFVDIDGKEVYRSHITA
jgi:tartrate-resistant acid phosphatase type 5